MASTMPMFDDNDNGMLFGDGDYLGATMPLECQCLAGELELQVASFECAGDLVGESPAGKSFSLTKDSGGSSLSALAVADFGSADFMDNVSLEELAAADHYGHTVCGRQSTADSAAAPSSGRNAGVGASGAWDPSSAQTAPRAPVAPPAAAHAEPAHHREQGACVDGQQYNAPSSYQQQQQAQQQQQQQAQHHARGQGPDSSDGDTCHSAGDGETSGVGHGGKGLAAGSESEESEDNMQGIAAAGGNDEEHMSGAMPSFGLSLARLRQAPQPRQRREEQLAQRQQQQQHQQFQAQPQGHPLRQQQQLQQQNPSMMTRAYSVDNMALSSAAAAGAAPDSATFLDGQRRAQMFRSYSFISPDCLPEDFELGCGDGGGGGGRGGAPLGARGRCASLNETQLRRQWLHGGELLAPQLPPSVSELELLELPEDAVVEPPLRPAGGSYSAGSAGAAGGRRGPGGGGMMLFRGASGLSAGGGGGGGGGGGEGPLPQPGTVKRKIITSPSPLLHAHKPAKARQAAAGGGAGAGCGARPAATPQGQSPKRAKTSPAGLPLPAAALGAGWHPQGGSAAGVLAGWHPPPAAARGGGMMKSIRSVPANMNSMAAAHAHGHAHGGFLDNIELAPRPLGPPGGGDAVISPNCSAASAGTPYHGFGARGGAGPFAEPAAPVGRPAGGATAAAAAWGAKAGKARGAGVPPPPPVVVPGMGLGLPSGSAPPIVGCFPEPGKRSTGPSIPKPRKRASPNGNPPKAPAPNPNGHCCTQCGTQTTPVWRAGPHGPKTLCNACGVRYMKVAKGNVAPTPRKQQQQQQQQHQ